MDILCYGLMVLLGEVGLTHCVLSVLPTVYGSLVQIKVFRLGVCVS